jgi:hypothetical protein
VYREARHDESDSRTDLGESLIGHSCEIPKAPGEGIVRNNAASHLVAHQNQGVGRVLDKAAKGLDMGFGGSAPFREEEVAHPEREAVDENRFLFGLQTVEETHELDGAFDGRPAGAPALSMEMDAVLHFIVQDLGCGNVDIGPVMLGDEIFGLAALAASGASQDQMRKVRGMWVVSHRGQASWSRRGVR